MALPATPPASFPPERLDPSRRAAPQVFERLRDQIIGLALPPGAPLSRTALQSEFGLSSTPIRDALMRLAEEGLVDVFPQHATLVSRIDVGRAQQAQFLRQALELEIVRLLALAPAAAPTDDLYALIAQQRRFAKDGDFASFTVVDNAFHERLYTAADKHELWTLVRSRSGHIDRLRRLHLPSPGKGQTILRHHKQIVDAIAAGRPDEAQAHLREHLTGTLSDLATIRSLWPDYLSG
ncbi:putative Transcriptional regulator, GntR family [Bradyrhizobium sp. ORS 285]|uniref:GntR family transcriptional regulator n=1 Tax=Bradyrhizobium sp. ORS 285 TaxID=115808 RepID=UPI0002407E78|nr:GntR family transcriptional regulator [Bradyrhizobium sp. ORS 285]CCD86748.1 putative Transcriptional regulator, GntR family [Bradyrhizobium sp. ORS 285]SMX61756.1 putative Transcriptional regulator, GntR family [Bradyrhizobium sp. ORS 285]